MEAPTHDYKTFKVFDLADPKGSRPTTFRVQPFVITVKAIGAISADKAAAHIKERLTTLGARVKGPLRLPLTYGHWHMIQGVSGHDLTKPRKPFRIYRVNLFVHDFSYPMVDAMHWMHVPFNAVFEITMMPKERLDKDAARREKQRQRWVARQQRKAQARAETGQ